MLCIQKIPDLIPVMANEKVLRWKQNFSCHYRWPFSWRAAAACQYYMARWSFSCRCQRSSILTAMVVSSAVCPRYLWHSEMLLLFMEVHIQLSQKLFGRGLHTEHSLQKICWFPGRSVHESASFRHSSQWCAERMVNALMRNLWL